MPVSPGLPVQHISKDHLAGLEANHLDTDFLRGTAVVWENFWVVVALSISAWPASPNCALSLESTIIRGTPLNLMAVVR
jgi:hypothetical protein